MKLEVQRFSGQDETTLGVLFDGTHGRRFLCFTLEDERRDVKVSGDTCILAGEYRLTLGTESGHHHRYSDRYPEVHKGMLWIRDVPGFEFNLIPVGNRDDDTERCLLVGDNAQQNISEEGSIGASRSAYQRIYPPIAESIQRGERVTISYVDYEIDQ